MTFLVFLLDLAKDPREIGEQWRQLSPSTGLHDETAESDIWRNIHLLTGLIYIEVTVYYMA